MSPTEVVERAAEAGVEWLALTDHDTHAGLDEAFCASQQQGIQLIPGAEWSLKWNKRDWHVLGLNVDPAHEAMTQLETYQQAARLKRAQQIGKRLDKAANLIGSYEKACTLADNPAPARPWFARMLLAEGRVRSMNHAFNRFLKKGQSAFVATPWASMEEGIAAIKAAGGTAVLAHPQHYKLTRTKLRRLLTAFCELGGEGLEVVMPNLTPHQNRLLAECLHDFSLVASGGSDFHSPEQKWLKLGGLPAMPAKARPVWDLW